jgi:hypothetical protein
VTRRAISAAVLLLLGAAACERGATAPAEPLSAAEARALAPGFDEVGFTLLDGVFPGLAGGTADVVTTTTTFQRTRPCPAGGSVAASGTVTRGVDAAARTLSYALTATAVHSACAFTGRDGVVTLNGAPGITLTAAQTYSATGPGVMAATQKGSFTWTRAGSTGTCVVDLASTFNPATKTATVKGTFCGQTVDVTRTRGAA